MPSRKPKDASVGTAAKAKTPARAGVKRKPAAPPPQDLSAKEDPSGKEGARNPALRIADRLLEAPASLLQAFKADSRQRTGGGSSPWPLNKFEDVFDQRVAESLARMGMPSPERLRALADALEQLLGDGQAQAPGRKRTK